MFYISFLSMAPTIVLDRASGSPVLGLGSPGGTRIPGQNLNVLYNLLLYGTGLQTAVDTVCLGFMGSSQCIRFIAKSTQHLSCFYIHTGAKIYLFESLNFYVIPSFGNDWYGYSRFLLAATKPTDYVAGDSETLRCFVRCSRALGLAEFRLYRDRS